MNRRTFIRVADGDSTGLRCQSSSLSSMARRALRPLREASKKTGPHTRRMTMAKPTLEELRARVQGQTIAVGDAAYDAARKVYKE